jgi:probable rRNA maturation factor
VQIDLDNRSSEPLDLDYYRQIARFVLIAEGAPANCELSLSFADEPEMQSLNRRYRGIDATTDVLSFPLDAELLGDVVVAPAQARHHARDFASDMDTEMRLLLVHGILHLLGYDHEDDAQAALMEARENELLIKLGYDCSLEAARAAAQKAAQEAAKKGSAP